ncbi:MAG: hypothetical protein M0P39_05805 [Rhodocyclaceae bacterium]|nr:hypothetical protein [Rhodocyclaceae bacterium]
MTNPSPQSLPRLLRRCAAFGGLLFAQTLIALAAPPAGHPSPQQVQDMLMPDKAPSARELPHRGKVKQSIDANEFTYIEVVEGKDIRWIAAPKMAVKPGSSIRYEDGSVMTNFYSKLLKRSFESVMFVGHVAVTAAP